MSIINDALKKVSKNNHQSGHQPAGIFAGAQRQQLESKRPLVRKWLLLGAVGVLTAVLISFIFSFSEDLPDSMQVVISEQANDTAAIFQVREADLEPALNISDFRLSGILYDQENPMAIINDQILKTGANIDEAQLLEIQTNFVRLSLNGREFQLEIK